MLSENGYQSDGGVGAVGRSPLPEQFPEAPDAERPTRSPQRGRGVVALTAILGGVVIALCWGAYGQDRRSVDAARTSAETAAFVATVRVARTQPSGDVLEIELPGETEPYEVAALNARATGYIAKRLVDIGSVVKQGDLLALIQSPELDQQLAQARSQLAQAEAALTQAHANVEQAKANYELANVTNARFDKLTTEGWATRQQGDNTRLALVARGADLANAEAGIRVAQANSDAQKAAVTRLEQLTGYERVVAPFDGVVTQRHVDAGDLVNADTSSGSGQQMFEISRIKLLRVRIDIPQSVANGVTDGIKAQVIVPELPGRTLSGTVARSSVSLAANSRTLRAEVDIDNQDLVLRSGQYVQVRLKVPRTGRSVTVPSEALIFNAQGTQVALVEDGIVKLRRVEILRDRGTELDIDQGLEGGETVVLNPWAELGDGQRVKVAPATLASAGAGPVSADVSTGRACRRCRRRWRSNAATGFRRKREAQTSGGP